MNKTLADTRKEEAKTPYYDKLKKILEESYICQTGEFQTSKAIREITKLFQEEMEINFGVDINVSTKDWECEYFDLTFELDKVTPTERDRLVKKFITKCREEAKKEGEALAVRRIRNYNFDGLGEEMERYILESARARLERLIPENETVVYANGDLRELADYHEKLGFQKAISIMQEAVKK
jgi:hypothetical protein